MANTSTILSSNHHKKAFHALGLLSLLLLMQRAGATEFKVGGTKGWTVPSANDLHYNPWAEMNRFQIGDSLLFVYPPDNDSVLQVNQDAYINCNTAEYIASFKDGNTKFTFDQSGSYYFISGNKDNCLKNEKMTVIVMADRSNQSSNSNQTILSPPPPSPSPPPSGSIEIIPSPAPVSEESPSSPTSSPSGASSIFVSFIGSFGAFVGSYLILIM